MASLTREAKIIAEAADRSVDPSRRSASERIRALQAQRDAVISKMVPVASARVVVRRACTAKGNGELAELAFIPKAASLGFGVARPFGDSERYDYILDSGERLWKVQVKATFSKFANGYRISMASHRNHRMRTYTAAEIDVLLAYIAPENVWYVIPVERILNVEAMYFYPSGCAQGGGLFEDCREDWQSMAPKACPGLVGWICCAADENLSDMPG